MSNTIQYLHPKHSHTGSIDLDSLTLDHNDLSDATKAQLASSISHDNIYALNLQRRAASESMPITHDLQLNPDGSVVSTPSKLRTPKKSLLKKSISQDVLNSEEDTQSQLRAKRNRLSKSVSFHDQVELVEINDEDNNENEQHNNQTSGENSPQVIRKNPSPRGSATKRFVQLTETEEYDFDKEDAKFRASQKGRILNVEAGKIGAAFNFAWIIAIVCVVISVIIATLVIIISLVVLSGKCSAPLENKYISIKKHSYPLSWDSSDQRIQNLIIKTTGDVRLFTNQQNSTGVNNINIVITHFSVTQKKQKYKQDNVAYTVEDQTLSIEITERYDVLAGLEGIWAGHLCSGSHVDVYLPYYPGSHFHTVSTSSVMQGDVLVNLTTPNNYHTSISNFTAFSALGDVSLDSVQVRSNLKIDSSNSAINLTRVILSGNASIASLTKPVYIEGLQTFNDMPLKLDVTNKLSNIFIGMGSNITNAQINTISTTTGAITLQVDPSSLCAVSSFDLKNSQYTTRKVLLVVPEHSLDLAVDTLHYKAGVLRSLNCEGFFYGKSNFFSASGTGNVTLEVR
ncbi:hypothetical protein AKO1_002541 [Acrasis kona]|uniref:Adhesin domain-containing protein n=1 Tax=Acrasis kona TaxID=1008807 RepID=A0AAW2ZP46_9EUKA